MNYIVIFCNYSILSIRNLNQQNIKMLKSNNFYKVKAISINKKINILKNPNNTEYELNNGYVMTSYNNDINFTKEIYNKIYYKNQIFENCKLLDNYTEEFEINNEYDFKNFKEIHKLNINPSLPVIIKQLSCDKIYYVKTYNNYKFSQNYKNLKRKTPFALISGILGLSILGINYIKKYN